MTLLTVVLAVGGQALADVGIVREANGCNYATLADALSNALPNDVLYVEPGTYNENNLVISFDLTVEQSAVGCAAPASSNHPIIDATGGPGRVVRVTGASTDVTFKNLKLRNGAGMSEGGVVLVEAADLTIEGSFVSGGSATQGGGIHVNGGGTLTLADTNVAENTAERGGGVGCANASVATTGGIIALNYAEEDGGGFWLSDCSVSTIRDTQVFLNTTGTTFPHGAGGGIHAAGTVLYLQGSTWVGRNDAVDGAGVFVEGSNEVGNGQLVMQNSSTVASNTASSGGGGVYLAGSILTGARADALMFHESSISGNTATQGGGVFLSSKSSFDMREGTRLQKNHAIGSSGRGGGIVAVADPGATSVNTFRAQIDDNDATTDGAGMYLLGGEHRFVDSVIQSNDAARDGGGVYAGDSARIELVNTHLWGNTARQFGGGLYMDSDASTRFDMTSEYESCDPSGLPANTYCTEARGNTAQVGGVAFVEGGGAFFTHTAMLENEAENGAATFAMTEAADVDLGTVLVAQNRASNGEGSIVHAWLGAQSDLFVSTVTDNQGLGVVYENGATGSMRSSIAYGNLVVDLTSDAAIGGSCNTVGTTAGVGLAIPPTTADPLFVTTGRGDYRLDGTSDPTVLNVCSTGQTRDLDDAARPAGRAYEKGAFEW